MRLSEVEPGAGYELIEVNEAGTPYDELMLRSWDHGTPTGIVIHRQGNPIVDGRPGSGARAADAIAWGIRTGAFSIHDYIDGRRVYACVELHRHAYHVLEWREAYEAGREIYRSRFMAAVPQWMTSPPNGQYAGSSRPRGDIGQYGIECVDRARPDGRIYLDVETRETLLLRVRDVMLAIARERGEWFRDTFLPVTAHSTWDQWTRRDDPGEALHILDFRADLLDLIAGREPWRTLGADYAGDRLRPERPERPLERPRQLVHEARSLAGELSRRLDEAAASLD